MQDGSVTIITIFELFKQRALIDADKIRAGSDDGRELKEAFNSFVNN